MSEPIRIALIAEGVTDYVVIRAAVSSVLGERSFLLRLIQPEESLAFTGAGAVGKMGGGWEGVYHWTKALLDRAGKLSDDDALLLGHDLFVMHLDADVADEDPSNYNPRPYPELKGVLPCVMPCPPPSDTTNNLRKVMVNWLGEKELPKYAVLCTPSKSMEAWVVPMCFPNDKESQKANWECRSNPDNRLSQQPKGVRFKKGDYQARHDQIKAGWGSIADRLSEAARFQKEFIEAVETLS